MYFDTDGVVAAAFRALTDDWQTVDEIHHKTGLGPSRIRDALMLAAGEGSCEHDGPDETGRVRLSARWRRSRRSRA